MSPVREDDGGVWRLDPPDRRTPIFVAAGACKLGQGCVCCPKYTGRRGQQECSHRHPLTDRRCSPPIPERIPACPEQQTRNQVPPTVKGRKAPRMQCCVECGRITGRMWTRVDPPQPWCGGKFIDTGE